MLAMPDNTLLLLFQSVKHYCPVKKSRMAIWQERAFLHNLAHISGKNDWNFMKISPQINL